MEKFKPISKEELEKLPKEVIEDVKKTLKCYSLCYVIFERGEYHVEIGVGMYAIYPKDYKFIGTVYAEDIYTAEERNKNYEEEFGYPPYPKFV